VFADGERDYLTGNGGRDWLMRDSDDSVSANGADVVDLISAAPPL